MIHFNNFLFSILLFFNALSIATVVSSNDQVLFWVETSNIHKWMCVKQIRSEYVYIPPILIQNLTKLYVGTLHSFKYNENQTYLEFFNTSFQLQSRQCNQSVKQTKITIQNGVKNQAKFFTFTNSNICITFFYFFIFHFHFKNHKTKMTVNSTKMNAFRLCLVEIIRNETNMGKSVMSSEVFEPFWEKVIQTCLINKLPHKFRGTEYFGRQPKSFQSLVFQQSMCVHPRNSSMFFLLACFFSFFLFCVM